MARSRSAPGPCLMDRVSWIGCARRRVDEGAGGCGGDDDAAPARDETRPSATSRTANGRQRCSSRSTRAARLSAVSSASTGTAACTMIGPSSTSARTKWTVQPARRTPAAIALAWVSSPLKAGRSEGWTLISRSRQRSTKSAVSTRMKPARTTSSTPSSSSASLSARSKAAREPWLRWSTTRWGRPARAARVRPKASARFGEHQHDLARGAGLGAVVDEGPEDWCRSPRSGRPPSAAPCRLPAVAGRRRSPWPGPHDTLRAGFVPSPAAARSTASQGRTHGWLASPRQHRPPRRVRLRAGAAARRRRGAGRLRVRRRERSRRRRGGLLGRGPRARHRRRPARCAGDPAAPPHRGGHRRCPRLRPMPLRRRSRDSPSTASWSRTPATARR